MNLRLRANKIGKLVAMATVCLLTNACVTASQVALQVGSTVVGKLIPIENYFPEIQLEEARRSAFSGGDDYRLCIDQIAGEERRIQSATRALEVISWCLKSAELSDEERTRLLAGQAILALETQQMSIVDQAVARLKGERLIVSNAGGNLDLIQRIRNVAAGAVHADSFEKPLTD